MILPYTPDFKVNGIDLFSENFLPANIKFPIGHPCKGVLYIAHPAEDNLYIPYEGSDQILLNDKMHELSFLLQCLGAEKITISSQKGHSVETFIKDSSSNGLGVSYKTIGGKGGYVNENIQNNISKSHNGIQITTTFSPMRQPYVPEGLKWLAGESSWKKIIQQRTQGNMLSYSLILSSKTFTQSYFSKMQNIRASLKIVFLKLNYEWGMTEERRYTEGVETVWKIDVKFKSRDLLHGK